MSEFQDDMDGLREAIRDAKAAPAFPPAALVAAIIRVAEKIEQGMETLGRELDVY